MALCFVLSMASFASETKIICNDQNSHSVLHLEFNEDFSVASLNTIQGDSSVIAEGTKRLWYQGIDEEEELDVFYGKTKTGKFISLILDLEKAKNLKQNEILDVSARFQLERNQDRDGKTTLLCSLN